MQRSKKLTRSSLAATAAIGLVTSLVGCQQSSDGGDSSTLTITSTWLRGEVIGDALRENVAAFEDETGIKVEIKDIPNTDILPAFEADYVAGDESDILITNLVGDFRHWATDGLTADAGPLIEEWGLTEAINKSAVDAWTSPDGLVYGLPYQGYPWPVWYNQALFDEAGVEIPTTYEELVSASAGLRAAGIQPLVIGGGEWPGLRFLNLVSQLYLEPDELISLVDKDGNFCEVPGFVKGLTLLSDMVKNGVIADDPAGYTNDTMVSAFFNGEAAMAHLGSWQFPAAPDDIRSTTVLGGFPVVDGGTYDKPAIFYAETGQGFWITRNGEKNLDAVEKFVKFLYSPETVNAFINKADLTPTTVVSADSPAPTNPLQAASLTIRDSTSVAPLWDTYGPIGFDPVPVAQSVYAGASPEEACKALEESWSAAKQG